MGGGGGRIKIIELILKTLLSDLCSTGKNEFACWKKYLNSSLFFLLSHTNFPFPFNFFPVKKLKGSYYSSSNKVIMPKLSSIQFNIKQKKLFYKSLKCQSQIFVQTLKILLTNPNDYSLEKVSIHFTFYCFLFIEKTLLLGMSSILRHA